MPLPADEPRVSLSQAARRYPGTRGAERMHPATLTRWILHGVKSISGDLVKLQAERIGCRWLTTEAALQRFAEALSGAAHESPAPTRTHTQRQRDAEAAGRRLAAKGA